MRLRTIRWQGSVHGKRRKAPCRSGGASCAGKGGTGCSACALSLFRRSSGAAHRNLLWRNGFEASAVRALRSLLHDRRSSDAGSHDGTGRIFGGGACPDFQSFWQCGKAVPFSAGIWRAETAGSDLDSHGKRSLSRGCIRRKSENIRGYARRGCGLWIPGFNE